MLVSGPKGWIEPGGWPARAVGGDVEIVMAATKDNLQLQLERLRKVRTVHAAVSCMRAALELESVSTGFLKRGGE